MNKKIKFICFDWGGTLAYSGWRGIFLHSLDINKKLSVLKRDTLPTLKLLNRKGIGMGIVTNTDKCIGCMLRSLKVTGLDKYFQFVIFSNDIGMCKKPCNKIFNFAINKIKKFDSSINPRNIMYVGNDYEKDVVGSNKVGMVSAFLAENRIIFNYVKLHGQQNILLRRIGDLIDVI